MGRRLLKLTLCAFFVATASFANGPTGDNSRRCEQILTKFLAPNYQPQRGKSRLDRIEDESSQHPSLLSLHDSRSDAERIAARERLLKAVAEENAEDVSHLNLVDTAVADDLAVRIANHPVTGHAADPKYNQNCKGFCFGRAVGLHITALKDGIDPTWMRKIWGVGEIGTDTFHVANLIRTKQGWRVADANRNTSYSVEEWMQMLDVQVAPGKHLSYFVTDSRRFGIHQSTHYAPHDLFGMGPRDQDFYSGYFIDFFEGLSE